MGFINNILNRFSLQSRNFSQSFREFGNSAADSIGKDPQEQIIKGYEGNTDVFTVIKRIVDTAKVIPFILEQRKGDDWVKVDTDNSLTELMKNPNPSKNLTWISYLEQLGVYYHATGNALTYGTTSVGFGDMIAQLDVLPSGLTEVVNKGSWFTPDPRYTMTIDGGMFTFTGEEVFNTMMFNPGYVDSNAMLWGLSPIQVAARAVITGNESWDARANIYKNKGAIGMVTDRSNNPMTPDDAVKVQSAFQERFGGSRNFNKVIVTNKDLNYIQLAMSPADLKLIESGIVTTESIAGVYGLDPNLFKGDSTFNNVNSANKQLYTNAVMPQNEKIAAMLNQSIVPTHFPNGDFRLRPDYSGVPVLQEDFNTKANTVRGLKTDGIMTANEAREQINLERIEDPEADVLTVTSSTVLLPTLSETEQTDPTPNNS